MKFSGKDHEFISGCDTLEMHVGGLAYKGRKQKRKSKQTGEGSLASGKPPEESTQGESAVSREPEGSSKIRAATRPLD